MMPGQTHPADTPTPHQAIGMKPRRQGIYALSVWLMLLAFLCFEGPEAFRQRTVEQPSDNPARISVLPATVAGSASVARNGPLILTLRHDAHDGTATTVRIHLPNRFKGNPDLALRSPVLLMVEEREGERLPNALRKPDGSPLATPAMLRAANRIMNFGVRTDQVMMTLSLGFILMIPMRYLQGRRARRAPATGSAP